MTLGYSDHSQRALMDMKVELTAAFSGGLFTVSGSVDGGQSSSLSSNAHRMLSRSTLNRKGSSEESP